MKTVGRTLFRKENIAEVCYSNKYIYTYIYMVSLQVYENFLDIYIYDYNCIYTRFNFWKYLRSFRNRK